MGRALVLIGLLLVGVGFVVLVGERLHLPFGRLPGDVSWRGSGWSVFVPIGTSLVLSVVLSLLLWLVRRFWS